MAHDAAWVRSIEKDYGRRTINEIRAEVNLRPVKGGEIAMVDWMKRMEGLPLRPELELLPGGRGT